MKDSEAEDIVRMIQGSVGGRMDPSVKEVYVASLVPLDADLATQAVLAGRRDWKWFPSWAEFREAYRAQERLREPFGEQRYAKKKPSCSTCNDDLFVVVGIRAPEKSGWSEEHGIGHSEELVYDEYAPCPDCNAGCETSFRRGHDGTFARTMDPGTVRMRMQS